MKKGWLILVGILVILVVIPGFAVQGTYNDIVAKEQEVNQQWAQVENVYQRRADLIPNLVATVKGYAAHESEVLETVTASRAQVGSVRISQDILKNPAEFQKFQQAQDSLGSALTRLMVVVEKYPDLKANQNFLELQSQLEGSENRIAQERRNFNRGAQDYNIRIKQFPANLVAGFFGFKEKQYFQSTPGSEKAPVVNFGK
ncbi:MAG: LemA family protein [Acidobacteriia bacterium]|nr:LemA family protein [Terriglobia bacterium]